MPESFGARLRQRREERQIALSSIADDTKIKLPLLEALERDDVSHWPSGIFRRAYIRAYAHMIGLDPDEVVREFLEVYPEPGEVAAAAAAQAEAEEATRRIGPPPTRLRNIVDSALGSLVRLRRPAAGEVPHPPVPSEVLTAVEHTSNRLVISDSAGLLNSTDMTGDDTVPGFRLDHLQANAGTMPPPAQEPTPELLSDDPDDTIPYGQRAPVPVLDAPVPDATVLDAPVPDVPAASEATVAAPRPPFSEPVNPQTAPPPATSPAISADLEAVAGLCTAFARVVDRNEVQRLLHEAARILDAIGLIVWVWDGTAEALTPALVYGYSDRVLAQLPTVRRDGDNVTAAAFRTGQTCELPGTTQSSGALVVPLLTPDGCAGVLALELQPGVEDTRSIRAAATILASVVTHLVLRIRIAETRAQSPKSPLRVRSERGSRIAGNQITGA